MPRFNVGDRVRCINPGRNNIIFGDIYTIESVGLGEEDDMVRVVGNHLLIYEHRFEPAVELPKKPMWVFVFKQDGEVRAHTRFNEASAQNLKHILVNSRNVHNLVCKKISITLTEAYIEDGEAGRE